jgi:hypothetical protein
MLYVVMQDAPGRAVDVKTMKIAHYPLGDQGRCNGLALDIQNHLLFAACANSEIRLLSRHSRRMAILSAEDGKIRTRNGTLTVVQEKSPTSFEVEQNLQTMNGARTITFDSKTSHILTMSQKRGPAPPPPPGGGRGPQGTPVPGSFTILMIGKQERAFPSNDASCRTPRPRRCR